MTIKPTDFFQALADSTRLRSLLLLQCEGELCVCELTHALAISQPKISRHLARLRETEVVLDRRMGQWIYYRINPDLPGWCHETLQASSKELQAHADHASDLLRLKDMPNRPGARCCA